MRFLYAGRKKRISIIRIIIALLIAIALFVTLLFGSLGIWPTIFGTIHQSITYKEISYTELTTEQRLEDFDYLMELCETSLPSLSNMEDVYGFSFSDRREYYRNMIAECENDYEFLAAVKAVAFDIPSGHATIYCPDYGDYFSTGVYRSNAGLELTDNIHGKLDAYKNYLAEKQKSYDELDSDLIVCRCVAGRYVCATDQDDINDAELISVNGADPREFGVSEPALYSDLRYDSRINAPYRTMLLFADKGDDAVEAVFRTEDGQTIEKTFYTDYDMLFYHLYGGLFTDEYMEEDTDKTFEAPPDADESSIFIQTDEERGIAYAYVNSLYFSNGDYIKNELRKVSGYDTVVIDLRSNGGGITSFWTNYMYPALYREDAYFEYSGYIPETKFTDRLWEGWFGGTLSKLVNDISVEEGLPVPEGVPACADKFTKYTFVHDMKGDSTLEYPDDRQVYFICNDSTCSSADEILQIVRQCKLGTIIGTDTMGEGLIFGICSDWMPNSLLMMIYAPCYAVDMDGVDNSLYGTIPDVIMGTSYEGYRKWSEIEENALLKNREIWDDNYKYILEQTEKNR